MDPETLKQKGWTDEEIERALNIVKYGKSNQKNSFLHDVVTKLAKWGGLIIAIVLNLFLTVILIPFMIAVKHSIVYLIIILFASGLGYVFSFLLKDIESIDPEHQVVSSIFIPAMGIINVYIVVTLTNSFIVLSGISQTPFDIIIISSIYVFSIMVAYWYFKIPEYIEKILGKIYKRSEVSKPPVQPSLQQQFPQ